MKTRKFISSVLIATLLCSSVSQGTIQEQDLIIYEGARYYTYTTPTLEESVPNISMPKFEMLHSANYKGYRASWAVIDAQLYLIGIEGKLKGRKEDGLLNSRQIFPDLEFPLKIKGYNGTVSFDGRSEDYTMRNGELIETIEIELLFKNGVVLDARRETINRKKIAREQGGALFETSSFRDDFEKHFIVSDVTAGNGSVFYTDNPEWRAHLEPIKPLQYDLMIEAVFPVKNIEFIDVKFSAEEILHCASVFMKHPYVVDKFENDNAARIRMRISGDRLHWWHTSKLKSYLDLGKRLDLDISDAKEWGIYILDPKEGSKYSTLYFDHKNEILMYVNSVKVSDGRNELRVCFMKSDGESFALKK